MSVQNALTTIQQYREKGNKKSGDFATLHDFMEMYPKENPPFTLEELKRAFQIDWDMRWLKHSHQ